MARQTHRGSMNGVRRLAATNRGAAGWLAILGLLVQFLVPFLHQPIAQAATPGGVIWDVSSICLPSGRLPADLAGQESGDSSAGKRACPLCSLLQHLTLAPPPAAPGLAHAPSQGGQTADAAPALAPPCWPVSSAEPRAPPLSV